MTPEKNISQLDVYILTNATSFLRERIPKGSVVIFAAEEPGYANQEFYSAEVVGDVNEERSFLLITKIKRMDEYALPATASLSAEPKNSLTLDRPVLPVQCIVEILPQKAQ